ncbi:MAG: hypothetical protein GXO08_02730 [Aquificae bacterium]|nr:hypothetical protein [Aquificota bacterium]
MIYTGWDGSVKVSVDYNPLRKKWKLTSKEGRKVVVIPSDRTLIKKENLPKGVKEGELRKFLKTKYRNYDFDFKVSGDNYTLVLVKNFKPPKDYFALDPEPFALARLSNLLKENDLQILNLEPDRFTWVLTKEGSFETYRTVGSPADLLLKFLKEERNLTEEQALRILTSEGLKNPAVRKGFEEVLKNLPLKRGIPLLPAGRWAEVPGLREFFEERGFKVVKLPHAEPERAAALGAALKFVFRDGAPSFGKPQVSPKELKAFALTTLAILVSFLLGLWALDRVKFEFLNRLNERKVFLFREKFPDLPPVAVEEQLKVLTSQRERSLLPRLERLISKVPKGVKIYEIGLVGGKLYLKGEGPPEVVNRMETSAVKKLESGGVAFEVVE